MIILDDNYVLSSTLSATGENENYPVTNIKHPFLEKIYKGNDSDETITINFGEDKTVDCCYVGLTNATTLTLRLYSSIGSLMSTKTLEPTYNCLKFTEINMVRFVTIQAQGASTIFIGSIGVGKSYKMPNPNMGVCENIIDNSITVTNAKGQTLTNKITPLRSIPLSFTTTSVDVYNQVKAIAVDNDRPIWCDVFELAHTRIPPMYARIKFSEPKQDYGRYTFNFDLTEAR